jgi:hypothetical protein
MAENYGVATYKGRKYKLCFLGDTKFGRRAKLSFWDGSKEFWVSADLVQVVNPIATRGPRSAAAYSKPAEGDNADDFAGPQDAPRNYGSRPACPMCGRRGGLVEDLEDGLYKCHSCCDMPGN